jgi:hypothetical protein
MAPHLKNGSPSGSIVEVSKTGYMNSDLFVTCLKHFIACVHSNPEKKVLLALDGHTTHSKNLEALNLVSRNGIILLQLPGHTTHRLQPLDVSVFGPMESYYEQAVEKWLKSNPGEVVTQNNVTELLGEAYGKAETVENALAGSRATVLWPVDRLDFTDRDFAPSEALRAPEHLDEEDITEGDTETSTVKETNVLVHNSSNSSLPTVPLEKISALPKGTTGINTRQKEAQNAVVLTSNPYKKELKTTKGKKVAKQAATIAKKTAQKEAAAVFKKR